MVVRVCKVTNGLKRSMLSATNYLSELKEQKTNIGVLEKGRKEQNGNKYKYSMG